MKSIAPWRTPTSRVPPEATVVALVTVRPALSAMVAPETTGREAMLDGSVAPLRFAPDKFAPASVAVARFEPRRSAPV